MLLREPVKRGAGFDGVQVFSATLSAARLQLGDRVEAWVAAHPSAKIVDIVVTQSSDAEYHCLTIVLFYCARGAD